MAKKMVHILVNEKVLDNQLDAQDAFKKIQRAAHLVDIDMERASMFGIVSGSVDEDEIAKLNLLDEVSSIEVDEKKGAF